MLTSFITDLRGKHQHIYNKIALRHAGVCNTFTPRLIFTCRCVNGRLLSPQNTRDLHVITCYTFTLSLVIPSHSGSSRDLRQEYTHKHYLHTLACDSFSSPEHMRVIRYIYRHTRPCGCLHKHTRYHQQDGYIYIQ